MARHKLHTFTVWKSKKRHREKKKKQVLYTFYSQPSKFEIQSNFVTSKKQNHFDHPGYYKLWQRYELIPLYVGSKGTSTKLIHLLRTCDVSSRLYLIASNPNILNLQKKLKVRSLWMAESLTVIWQNIVVIRPNLGPLNMLSYYVHNGVKPRTWGVHLRHKCQCADHDHRLGQRLSTLTPE